MYCDFFWTTIFQNTMTLLIKKILYQGNIKKRQNNVKRFQQANMLLEVLISRTYLVHFSHYCYVANWTVVNLTL